MKRFFLNRVRRLSRPAALISCLFALAAAGCSSLSGPGSASFASVVIKDHTVHEIAVATVKVFGEDGYRGGATGDGKLVFEKEASRGSTFAREGLVATAYGAQTVNRVRVEIVPLTGGEYSLQCKAFKVTGGNDPFFQNEVPLSNARSGPYRSLLKKVAKELK